MSFRCFGSTIIFPATKGAFAMLLTKDVGIKKGIIYNKVVMRIHHDMLSAGTETDKHA